MDVLQHLTRFLCAVELQGAVADQDDLASPPRVHIGAESGPLAESSSGNPEA